MKQEKYDVLLKVIDRWDIDVETGEIRARKGVSNTKDVNGYKIINTTFEGKQYYFKHHQVIVVKAGFNPVGKTVNHINGKKDDNRIENLEVVSVQENTIHAHRTGLAKPHNKLSDELVEYILDNYDGSFNYSSRMAEELGLHPDTIGRITKEKRIERDNKIIKYVEENYDGSFGCIARIAKELNVSRDKINSVLKKKALV